ncbi:MAG: N-methyl-L-tryptophan oxidase, partial [Terriglobia bacterium]
MDRYDVIVIGIGGMGSSSAYHLARRGARVLGLERFNIPNEMGSSHGVTRIIRLAYYEHPSYVPLLLRAYELWRELENLSGERLLFITGSVDAGPRDGEIIKGALQACEHFHLNYEEMDGADLHARFPGYRLPKDMAAVYQPDGGFLLSEKAIVAHVRLAQALGAEIRAREQVLDWGPGRDFVQVRTTQKTYQATSLVITAGPWMPKLANNLIGLAKPERQVVMWAQPIRPDYFQLGAFPVFNLEAPEGRFYGFPVYGIPGFKLGKYHHRREHADPDHMDRECHPQDEQVLREAVERYFPDANGPTM